MEELLHPAQDRHVFDIADDQRRRAIAGVVSLVIMFSS